MTITEQRSIVLFLRDNALECYDILSNKCQVIRDVSLDSGVVSFVESGNMIAATTMNEELVEIVPYTDESGVKFDVIHMDYTRDIRHIEPFHDGILVLYNNNRLVNLRYDDTTKQYVTAFFDDSVLSVVSHSSSVIAVVELTTGERKILGDSRQNTGGISSRKIPDGAYFAVLGVHSAVLVLDHGMLSIYRGARNDTPLKSVGNRSYISFKGREPFIDGGDVPLAATGQELSSDSLFLQENVLAIKRLNCHRDSDYYSETGLIKIFKIALLDNSIMLVSGIPVAQGVSAI